MGTHGQRGIVRFLLGSVAERVLRLSETPVLVVRQQTDADSKIDSDDETSATD
nr:universal stress protein [Halococcus thailandensis]